MDFGYTPLGSITVGGVELKIPEGSTANRIYITVQWRNSVNLPNKLTVMKFS